MTSQIRIRTSRRRADGGQSLVEFALVAPIFFLLVFAIIQIGIVYGAQNALVNGVRDAARKAATYRVNEASYDDATTWSAICQSIEDTLRESVGTYPAANVSNTTLRATITYTWEQSLTSTDYFLVAHISADYDHTLYVPLVSFFLDSSDGSADGKLTLTADERMRIENPALTQPASNPPAC